MTEEQTPPLYDEATIRMTLRRWRQARPLSDSPLKQLVWVRQRLDQRRPHTNRDIGLELGEALADLIEQNLSHHRRVEGLPPPTDGDREVSLDELRADFTRENAELEAWSVLYYRYARMDLDLAAQTIANELNIDERQVRRRAQHGYRRLAEAISRLERTARAENWQLWMLTKLPPAMYTDLFGLSERLEALINLLTGVNSPHVIILVGPGGIGKTTLARAAARHLIEQTRFDDFAWLTLEGPVAYRTLLTDLARDLGYPHFADEEMRNLEANLQVRLAQIPTLVVIDSLRYLDEWQEHLPRLGALIGPGCLLLASRRHPAANAPAHIYPVTRLPLEDFTGLLYATARQQRMSRTEKLDDGTVSLIDQLTEGNPLAGRLIVYQLKVFPPERVLDNLANLKLRNGTGLFDALFQPAWEAVGENAQIVALALAIRPGGMAGWPELDESLELPAERIDDALRRLADVCLIDVLGDEPHYVMGSMARQFVQGQAEQPPLWDYYQRLLDKTVESYDVPPDEPDDRPPAPPNLISLLRRQINLRKPSNTLVSRVLDYAPAARQTGQWLVWRDVLEQTIDHIRELGASSNYLAPALVELGITRRWLGEYQAAQEAFEEAVQAAGQGDDFIVRARALLEAGRLYEVLGQSGLAFEAYQHAARAGYRYGQTGLRRQALNGLVGLALGNERIEEALALLDQVLETFGEEEPDGQTLAALGTAYLETGEIETAIAYQQQALDTFHRQGDLPHLARSHMRLGIAYHQAGDSDRAFEHLQSGLNLMRTLGDVLGLSRLLNNLGVVHADQIQQDSALAVWQEAFSLQELIDDQIGMAYTCYNLADLRWKLNQIQAARQDMERARFLAERLNLVSLLATVEGHPLNQTQGWQG